MQKESKLVLLIAGMLLFHATAFCDDRELIKAIQFTLPSGVAPLKVPLRSDPGDDPLALNGPGFSCAGWDRQRSEADFQICFARAYVGEGKAIHFLSAETSDLKQELEKQYKDRFPDALPATVGKIDGLTAISLATTSSVGVSRFICWVQLETNIVLKIHGVSCSAETFRTLTNQLYAVKIDKAQVLKSLEPKLPEITKSHLDSVSVGFMQWRGQRAGVLVFRSNGGVFSFVIGDDGKPDKTVKSSFEVLEKMQNLPPEPNTLRMVVVDKGRIGDGPGDYQTAISFLAETNAINIAQLKRKEYRVTPLYLSWESWTNREPEAFQKVGEFKMDATLLMRKTENY
jgi:hypothetical protein